MPQEPLELGALASEVEADTAAHQALMQRLVTQPSPSAMLTTLGPVMRWLASFLFTHVAFEQRSVEALRQASHQGPLVYVMQSRSKLDYLYFNWALLKHELPLARFAPDLAWVGWPGALARLRQRFSRAQPGATPGPQQLEAWVLHAQAAFLFLERPGRSAEENQEDSQRYLYQLVRAQRRHARPIQVAPLSLLWERRPDPEHASLLGELFGTPLRPGFWRKLLGVVQTTWQSFFKVGQPLAQVSTILSLPELLAQYPNAGSADASELLRQRLLDLMAQERHVALGPVGQPVEQVYQRILHRPELTRAIGQLALKERVSEEVIKRRVRRHFDEIAAAQSPLMLKIFSLILSMVWYRIYDGFEVDEEGLARVREAGKTSSLVLIPSHKSHIDYLIISYLFYHHGLAPPHIAAGVNLSFFPMGALFRRCGAFFIRRSFKGEELYPLVFREYLIGLMQQSYPIEFFIEGTRSRTGKLIKPRYGMLEMIVQAFVTGRVDAVTLVPISVGYEKIIESASYRHEILGGQKKKESLTELLKTPKFLASRYGRLYVQFGEPIALGDYLTRFGVDKLRPDAAQLEALVVRLAHRVIYDINRVTAVTPTALVAMLLLNNTTRHMELARMTQEAGFVMRSLTQLERVVRLSRTLRQSLRQVEHLLGQSPEQTGASQAQDQEAAIGEAMTEVMIEALELFERNGLVQLTREGQARFYGVPEQARVELAFYRNNIIHLFVPEALLATALLRSSQPRQPLRDVMQETRFLSRLFKYEWIYEERAEFENVFMRTLRSFERAGWVSLAEQDMIQLLGPDHVELEFMRRLALTFLEAYALLAQRLEALAEQAPQTWIERDALLDEALAQGRHQFLAGRILFFESLSKPTLLNALRVFVDWGLVHERREPGKKREVVYVTTSPGWRDAQPEGLWPHLDALVYRERSRARQPTLTTSLA